MYYLLNRKILVCFKGNINIYSYAGTVPKLFVPPDNRVFKKGSLNIPIPIQRPFPTQLSEPARTTDTTGDTAQPGPSKEQPIDEPSESKRTKRPNEDSKSASDAKKPKIDDELREQLVEEMSKKFVTKEYMEANNSVLVQQILAGINKLPPVENPAVEKL